MLSNTMWSLEYPVNLGIGEQTKEWSSNGDYSVKLINTDPEWKWVQITAPASNTVNSFEIKITILTNNDVRLYGVGFENGSSTLLNYVSISASEHPQIINLTSSPQTSTFTSLGFRIVLVSQPSTCYCDDFTIKFE